ncbi:MAG: peptide ABC transporter permease, partial [Rhodobacteraceae bacterium]|nr:peptide ABC transporter permease [Paracoccaceae bacterium]
MILFILRRIALLIPTILGITIVAFGFVRVLPGDPVLLMAGERGLSEERYAEMLKQFGYDQPIWRQYIDYLGDLLRGDFGNSIVTKKPVLTEFFALFPATVELAFCAILIAILVGIPAGVFAASRRGKLVDQVLMGTALVGYSMPIF